MRIADVCGFYAPRGGGVRRYAEQKFAAARRRGHDLTLIAPGREAKIETRAGGRIVWVESPPMPFDPDYRRFARPGPVWRILDGAAPDVVEGSSPWRGGWIAAHWPGAAVRSFVFHQDFVAGYPHTLLDRLVAPAVIDRLFAPYWARLRALSAAFDVTVAGGEWLARRLAGFGVHCPVAIPLGIEPGRFSPDRADPMLRAELLALCGAPPSGRLLLAVGRFHPEKRHATIIDGFVRARERSPSPLGLVLVGDGLARRGIERAARRAGGVHLLGEVDDRARLARLYASADVLVHGSAAETYGMAVAEALASGLPVVVPAGGGAADLAGAGPSRLHPPGDAAALAAGLLDLLAVPAPRVPADIPTADAHFDALFGLYERLLAARRSREPSPRSSRGENLWGRRRGRCDHRRCQQPLEASHAKSE